MKISINNLSISKFENFNAFGISANILPKIM